MVSKEAHPQFNHRCDFKSYIEKGKYIKEENV